MITDILFAIATAYGLARLASLLAGTDPVARFATAVLAGTVLLVGVGIALLLRDAYSVSRLLLACALLAQIAWIAVGIAWSPPAGSPAAGAGNRVPVLLLLGLVALPLASPGYEIIAMGSDAGVYINHAMQLEHDGRRFPTEAIDVAHLPPDLRARYLEDNRAAADPRAPIVEGLKVRADGRLEFHALAGWPVLLSVGGRLLGIEHAQFVSVPILMAFGGFVFLALRALSANLLLASVCAAASMALPIVVYFSHYPTVESLLAMLAAGIAWLLLSGVRFRGLLAGLAFSAFALIHLSSFLLLLIACLGAPFVLAALEPAGRRHGAAFLVVAGLAQMGALEAAHLLSPGYMSDLFSLSFGSYRNGLYVVGLLALAAIGIAVVAYPRGKRHVG